jgi:5,10-methylenetetrahydrofolate reductase
VAFLRVVEVFPPLFPASGAPGQNLPLEAKTELTVEGVRSVREYSDLFLVADVKSQKRLGVSTIETSARLQDRLGVEAAPVIVTRDMNRPKFLSSFLTAVSLGLKSVMFAWGDDYPPGSGITNVRDFGTLAEAIKMASLLRRRARAHVRFFAPVDLDSLDRPEGASVARGRLRAGAELLLAQPPTTDDGGAFERHMSLVRRAGLEGRVIFNVFPFRDEEDVRGCESKFGWRLPRELHRIAKKGEPALLGAERGVVRRARREGFPGVYITTRGTPGIASKLLS